MKYLDGDFFFIELGKYGWRFSSVIFPEITKTFPCINNRENFLSKMRNAVKIVHRSSAFFCSMAWRSKFSILTHSKRIYCLKKFVFKKIIKAFLISTKSYPDTLTKANRSFKKKRNRINMFVNGKNMPWRFQFTADVQIILYEKSTRVFLPFKILLPK